MLLQKNAIEIIYVKIISSFNTAFRITCNSFVLQLLIEFDMFEHQQFKNNYQIVDQWYTMTAKIEYEINNSIISYSYFEIYCNNSQIIW